MTHSDDYRKLRESNATVTDERWLDLTERLFLQRTAGAQLKGAQVAEAARDAGRDAKTFYDQLCRGGTAILCRDERKFKDGFPEETWSKEDWAVFHREMLVRDLERTEGVGIDDLNGELSEEVMDAAIEANGGKLPPEWYS